MEVTFHATSSSSTRGPEQTEAHDHRLWHLGQTKADGHRRYSASRVVAVKASAIAGGFRLSSGRFENQD
jgi:hypothetical protein